MKKALFYKKLKGKKVQCFLCYHHCTINEGMTGVCGVRKNINGELYSLVYAHPVSVNVDPIEKKPLFHFLPGSKALSYCTVGCNFKCDFCQNWSISQAQPKDITADEISAKEIVELALETGSRVIAHTYTEPTVFYEYAYDIAKLAHRKGLKNVFVTNGFMESKPLKKIARYLDAANIDLKSFDPAFYERVCKADLNKVLRCIKEYYDLGIWIELTNLIIPGLNDSTKPIKEMCEWVVKNLSPSVPLHFSAFHPCYKMMNKPSTPLSTLKKAKRVAEKTGLKHVYLGNVGVGEDTYCPKCHELLIARTGYVVNNFLNKGCCPKCGVALEGVFY